jgi:hypothetical protein
MESFPQGVGPGLRDKRCKGGSSLSKAAFFLTALKMGDEVARRSRDGEGVTAPSAETA